MPGPWLWPGQKSSAQMTIEVRLMKLQHPTMAEITVTGLCRNGGWNQELIWLWRIPNTKSFQLIR